MFLEIQHDVVHTESSVICIKLNTAKFAVSNCLFLRFVYNIIGIASLLWAGWSWDQIPVRARFSTPIQTSPGAHPASYTEVLISP